LEQVLELEGDARQARIDELCAGDAALLSEVRRLVDLEADDSGSGAAMRLDDTAFDKFLGLPKALGAGATHGGFRIERELGAGGMGHVYEAVQEHPRRQVALKVLRPELATEAYIARFQREQSILASLQHPGIAQIYEAGLWSDDSGQVWPFFAMEFVRGAQTIRQYAAQQPLTLKQKVELLRDVCEAVEEAHRRGVVHRDLKPDNLLIDEGGHVKVIDFGIARTAGSDATSSPNLTRTGEMVGTIRFMSPEQVHGAAVDARSDVYSLGVVIYETLCGRSPYGDVAEELTPLALAVTQTEPVRPGLIEPSLRDDLEWVLVRALEKAPSRRYETAGALGDDLTAYLEGRPVAAGPPTLTYRAWRLISRNKLPAALVLALIVGLTTAGVISATLYLDARDEELQKQFEAQNAATARRSLLASITNLQSRAAERTRVDKMLAQASRDAGEVFRDDPRGELLARVELARSMQCVGMIKAAEAEAVRCLAMLGERADPADDLVAELRFYLAQAAYNQGQAREALEIARDTVKEAAASGGSACLGAIRAKADLGNLLVITRADVRAGTQLLEQARSQLQRLEAPQHALLLRAEGHLAIAWTLTGRADEGLALIQSVIQRTAADGGDADPRAIMLRLDEAQALSALGRATDAADAAKASLDGVEAELPADHPLRLFTLAATSFFVARNGDYEGALDLLEPNLPLLIRVWGAEHPETLKAESVLAEALEWTGQPEKALQTHARLLDRARTALGADSAQLVPYLYGLGAALERAGRVADSLPPFEEVVELTTIAYGPAQPNVLRLQLKLASHYVELDRYVEAKAKLATLQQQSDQGAADMLGEIKMLEGRVLIKSGDFAGARKSLQQAKSWFSKREGPASTSAKAAAAALRACEAADKQRR